MHESRGARGRLRRLFIRHHLPRRAAAGLHPRPGFLENVSVAPNSWRAEHWLAGGAMLLLTALGGIILPSWAGATRHEAVPIVLPLEIPTLESDFDALLEDGASESTEWRRVTVQPGQSLSNIFQQQGFSASLLQRALDSQDDASALRRIRPGQEFAFASDALGELRAMRFERDDATRVVLRFEGETVREEAQARALERRTHLTHGVVTQSLFYAGEQAGLSDVMVLRLANAFAYDIDFAQDLREGDSFSLLYDDLYRDGERLRDGDVIAATFINQGKRYTALRYTNAAGETLFYTADGRPLRRSFLRTPVEFTRISSQFSTGRKHPILGYMRAHKGVDYAAPTGTPVRAAGDGKIVFRGWQSGYGNFVRIQHDKRISTAYGHLSRFARLKVGERVRQGQTIGYVGMTGLATGPHLHYEFRVSGEHRNPLTVTLPPAQPLPPTELARFRSQTAPLLARLEWLDDLRLAQASR